MLIDLNVLAENLRTQYHDQYSHRDLRVPNNVQNSYSKFLDNKSLGYASVHFHSFSFEITTSTNKKISIPNYWFYAAAFFVQYLTELKKYKEFYNNVSRELQLPNNWAVGAKKNPVTIPISVENLSNAGFSTEDSKLFIKFISDYEWWGGGKTIDRTDYYVSPILKLGNFLAESQSAVAELCWQLSEQDGEVISQLNNAFSRVTSDSRYFDSPVLEKVVYKPFLLLAGISGTGKTRFVRRQAEAASGSLDENYCLVSVRPDWHEPSDLLGYVSRLSGTAHYVTTDVLCFIVKAWKAIISKGIHLDSNKAKGNKADLSSVLPYWLCLDEMNLAPVEQYFADYLSVLETREWDYDGEEFIYSCDALVKASVIQSVNAEDLRKNLLLEDEQFDQLWDQFCCNGISLPFNLIVAGTVNMDETTHGFSRKVIDRALSFDFGEFFPNVFDDFFEARSKPYIFSYPRYSSGRDLEALSQVDVDPKGQKTIAFLSAVNMVLEGTTFKLAYRALNELLLSVITIKPKDDKALLAVWDDFVMCKILPRIEGDIDKLTLFGRSDKDGTQSLLDELMKVLSTQLDEIWGGEHSRPDLYRHSSNDENASISIDCRSRKKLKQMDGRLKNSGFTSFWP